MEITEYEIVFVESGVFSISIGCVKENKKLDAGDFVFIPQGTNVSYNAIQDSSLLCVRVIKPINECSVFRINKRYNQEYQTPCIYVLKANDIVRLFLKSLMLSINRINCRQYMHAKATEFILLLHACYSETECHEFFALINSSDLSFTEFVRKNYHNTSVSEMSRILRITPYHFTAKFKRIFGKNPNEWVKTERAKKIYDDICQSDKSIKKIALDNQFANLANFTRYCRNNYDFSPSELRENLIK